MDNDVPSLSDEFRRYRAQLMQSMPETKREIDPFFMEAILDLKESTAIMETKLEAHLEESTSWKAKVDAQLKFLSNTLDSILREHRVVWLTAGSVLGILGEKILSRLVSP